MLIVLALLLLSLLIADFYIIPKYQHIRSLYTYVCLAVFLVALLYGGLIYKVEGWQHAAAYYAAYAVEYALSIDNIFVFYMIFKKMKLTQPAQRHVLSWGLWSAIFMRGIFIYGGITLMEHFQWMTYVFGIFLVYAAFQMLLRQKESRQEESKILQFLQKHLRMTTHEQGLSFFVRQHGKRYVTPLFMTLCAIELSDLLFALDSVSAVLAISREMHVVYAANILAIVGLRSLYFVLAETVEKFDGLIDALGIILIFIAVKMLLSAWVEIPILVTLLFIILLLTGSIMVSRLRKKH